MVLVVSNHAIIWPMRAGDDTSAFLYGVAYGTVAAFAAVTGYIGGMRPPPSHPARTIRHRAFQLLLPWAFWAVVYAAAPLLWEALEGAAALPSGFAPWPWARALLLGGGPLWFLPVIFLAAVVGVILDGRTRSWWPVWVMFAAYALTATLAWRADLSPLAFGKGTFWAVAPLYVASYWAGLRLARDGVPAWSLRIGWPTIIVTASLAGVVTLVRARTGDATLMWLAYPVGLPGGWAALALAAHAPDAAPASASGITRLLERAGVASRGVYVLHPLVVGPVMLGVSAIAPNAVVMLVAALIVTPLGAWVSTLLAERARRTAHGHALI